MNDKPSYLGLLNAIAVGESRGYELLSEWGKRAQSPELTQVLNLVAIREHEHAAAFTKRLCELGYDVRQKSSGRFDEHLALAKSDADDREKFEEILGYGPGKQDPVRDDPLANLFEDESIDPQTGALLGRFIAEERDSGKRLRSAYQQLDGPQSEDAVLKQIVERLDRLSGTLEELKTLRR